MARPQLSTPLPATHTSATGMRTKETLTPPMVRMSALLLHTREHKHWNWTRCGAESTHPEPTSHRNAFTRGREPRSTRSALTEFGDGRHINFLLSVERSVHPTCCMVLLMLHMMRHDAHRYTNSLPQKKQKQSGSHSILRDVCEMSNTLCETIVLCLPNTFVRCMPPKHISSLKTVLKEKEADWHDPRTMSTQEVSQSR